MQTARSAAGNLVQFLASSSRERCSNSRQFVYLSLTCSLPPTRGAPRQLFVTSQFGTPSATTTKCTANGNTKKGIFKLDSFNSHNSQVCVATYIVALTVSLVCFECTIMHVSQKVTSAHAVVERAELRGESRPAEFWPEHVCNETRCTRIDIRASDPIEPLPLIIKSSKITNNVSERFSRPPLKTCYFSLLFFIGLRHVLS